MEYEKLKNYERYWRANRSIEQRIMAMKSAETSITPQAGDGSQHIGRNIGIGRQTILIFPIVHHRFNDKVFSNNLIAYIGTGEVDETLLILYKELIKSI